MDFHLDHLFWISVTLSDNFFITCVCTICAGWCVQVWKPEELCVITSCLPPFCGFQRLNSGCQASAISCGAVSSAYIKSFPVLIFEVVVVVVTTESGREALGLSSSTANDQNNQRVLVSADFAWKLGVYHFEYLFSLSFHLLRFLK